MRRIYAAGAIRPADALFEGEGIVFYTAGELIDYFRAEGQFPANGITITFDDGCQDSYTNAFPVLRELGIKATIFLVPSVVGVTPAKPLAQGEEGAAAPVARRNFGNGQARN